MEENQRLDPHTLDEVLGGLLGDNPDAPIAAVTPEGAFRSMPEGFDPGARPVLPGGSAMEFVPPDARGAVIEAWQQAHEVGVSRTVMPAAADPDERIVVHLVDATHRYGVYFAVIVPTGDGVLGPRQVEPVRERTKMGRVRKDAVSTIVGVDEGAVELLGFQSDDVVGRRSLDFVHPDDHDRAIDCWMAMLSDPGNTRSVRFRHLRKDGTYVWVDVSNRNLLESAEECVLADMVDVSDEMAAQEALRAREQLLARLTEALPLGVLQIDLDRSVVFANQRFYEIVGSDSEGDLDRHLVTLVDGDRETLAQALAGALDDGRDGDLRVRMQRPGDHEMRLLHVGLRTLTGDDGRVTGAVACVEDVTEGVLLQIELANRATYDDLTGCFNRASTMGALGELLTSDLHAKSGTALVFFDVDDLKQMNDQLGHAAGDEVLRTVTQRAAGVLRHHDIVGRLGGDEFLVICPGMGDETVAMALARRIGEAVNQPVHWDGVAIEVRISLGVVWCDAQPVEADRLIAQADRHMYESKGGGTGSPVGHPAEARPAA